MSEPNPEHIRELLVPYSLGVLSVDEARSVRAALDGSQELRAELRAIETAAAALIEGSVQMETAPSFIKARVLDSIGAADRTSTAARKRADRRGTWRALIPSIVAAAAAGACVILAVVAISLHGDLDHANHRLTSETQRADTVPSDVSLRTVSTTGDLAPAAGQLVRVGDDRYVLLLHDVPNPGVGNSWQVWSQDSHGKVRNIGKWVNGSSTQAILVSSNNIRKVMISHEPSLRAMSAPSGAPLASIAI